jgi:iron complex outermembrane receptor protein
VNRGFKAGGFNPQAPSGGHLPFDEEFSWHYEGGVKSVWLDSRILTNVAVFFIDWDNLQTFVPNPQDPSNFLIDNVGSATSTGVEFEVQTRPVQGLDVFAAVGFTSGEYGDDAVAGGFPVANNDLMLTPDYTASIGVQYTHRVGNTNVFGRADIANYGKFFYDESNVLSQGAYSLTNLRGGVTFRQIIVEAFLRNAFDERYIPVLFPYQFAPSGFIGEVGAPRTFGVNLGARF